MQQTVLLLLVLCISCALSAPAIPAQAAAVSQQIEASNTQHQIQRRSIPTATPYSRLTQAQIAIYLTYDTASYTDLDTLFFDDRGTWSCRLNNKGSSNIACNDAGHDDTTFYTATMGGVSSSVNGAGPTTLDLDSTSASSVPGVEVILIDTPNIGAYHHFVYEYGDRISGFHGAPASSVIAKVYYDNGAATINSNTFSISTATNVSSCYGRFWNTFTLHVTASNPVAFTVTSVNTITPTAYTSEGTSARQTFEDGLPYTRDNTGCSTV